MGVPLLDIAFVPNWAFMRGFDALMMFLIQ